MIIGSCIHWHRYTFTYVYKIWIEYISNIMLYYNVMLFSQIYEQYFFINSVLPNNTIYLLPGAFTISLKLLLKFTIKIIYFCMPYLIYDKISKSWVELMGHFILSNQKTLLSCKVVCQNLTPLTLPPETFLIYMLEIKR